MSTTGKSPAQKIPLLDLKSQFARIRDEIMPAIEEVCESQYFVMGPKVAALEAEAAAYCGATHGIGVSSGTDALLAALMALGVGSGDAVITTPYTFFSTGGVVARLGARPLFCDIDEDSYNLDLACVERLVETECDMRDDRLIHRATQTHVKVVMPVHLYGQMVDMSALMAVARPLNLRVVEDAAQAIGSEDANGNRAGVLGDIGCFSFFPSKNLGAFGDGGLCTTNDDALAEKLRVLRVHGGKPKYYHSMVGGNFRLDAIQAAVLSVKLKHLDHWTSARQANAAYYDKAFPAAIGPHKVKTPRHLGGRHIYNQYVIRVNRRDELRTYLAEHGISTEIYYPVPLHLQECFADLGYTKGSCPVSEAAAESTVAIPVYPELNQNQQDYVVDRIAAFCD